VTGLILLGLLIAIAGYAIVIYNSLVSNKNHVEEGWSGIETQLKRRSNLIPNLVETVKGYASHEKGVMEEVTQLRARSDSGGSVGERAAVEGQLGAALGRLLAVAEAYPDLKASANFTELQGSLADIENEIQLARRYYNGTVRRLNTQIEQFPSNLVANGFGFEQAEFFEIEDDGDRAVPKVEF
jgi:LemA protein